MGSSAGGTKTDVNIPPKTEEEKALIRQQTELLKLQVEDAKRQSAALEAIFPEQKKLLQAQTEFMLDQVKLQARTLDVLDKSLVETPMQKQIREAAESRTLAFIEGRAPALPPGQEALIDETYAAEQKKGELDLDRFLGQMAATRGLSLTDSPVAAEAARARENLASGLAGAKARTKLEAGQKSLGFAEEVRRFQEGLKDFATQNRLALVGQPAGRLALGTSPGQAFASGQKLLNQYQNERLQAATVTERVSEDTTTRDLVAAGTAIASVAVLAFA